MWDKYLQQHLTGMCIYMLMCRQVSIFLSAVLRPDMETALRLVSVVLVLGTLVSGARARVELTDEELEILDSLPEKDRENILEAMKTDEYTDGHYYKKGKELTEVPNDIPSDAISVSLEDNLITDIPPGTFSHLPNLTHLSLFWNRIEVVKAEMWEGLENLEELDVSKNNIGDNVDCAAFEHLSSLTFLNLAQNKITYIDPCWWQGLESLSKGLILSVNDITEIRGDVWTGLFSLTYITLWKNKISDLPPRAFRNLPSLSVLTLGQNRLTTVPENIFYAGDYPDSDGHPSRLYLFIDENPLQCDDKMCWIKDGEKEGWMQVDFPDHHLECVNYPNTAWKNISLCD